MDILDQYSIVDCDLVVEKRSFHWNGHVVSYILFCINYMEFPGFGIYLIDVVLELICSQ